MLSQADPEPLEALELVLTARCNLKCAYCYQNDKKPRSMSWDTLWGALDLLLRSNSPEVEVLFLGGEPLLEFALIRRAVEYVQGARPQGRAVRYVLITNGTLLGEEQVEFLDQNGVRVQLSFDGVPEAQERRSTGTFEVLDDLLDRLRRDHPQLFRERLTVSLTVNSAMIPHLAASIVYFLGKGVQEISLAPIVTHDPGWTDGMIGALDAQFSRTFDACLGHYRHTGEVPLLAFRKTRKRGSQPPASRHDVPRSGGSHARRGRGRPGARLRRVRGVLPEGSLAVPSQLHRGPAPG